MTHNIYSFRLLRIIVNLSTVSIVRDHMVDWITAISLLSTVLIKLYLAVLLDKRLWLNKRSYGTVKANFELRPPFGCYTSETRRLTVKTSKKHVLNVKQFKKEQKHRHLNTNPTEDGAMEVYPGDRGAQELGERCEN